MRVAVLFCLMKTVLAAFQNNALAGAQGVDEICTVQT